MKWKFVSFVVVVSVSVFLGCQGNNSTPQVLESGVLSPQQLDSSLVGQLVKVRGEVNWVVQFPGGRGGLYAKLGSEDTKVGVRIQEKVWATYNEKEKSQFESGKIVTVEGVLAQAGGQLVVVVGGDLP